MESHMPIRVAILSFLTLAIFVLVTITGFHIIEQHHVAISSAQEVNVGIARILADSVRHTTTSADLIHDHIVDRIQKYGLGSLATSEGHLYLQMLDDRYPEVAFISVFDGSGRAIGHSQHTDVPKIQVGEREWFVKHVNGDDQYIGPPIVSFVEKKEVFTQSRAIRAKDGRLEAAILVAFDRGYMERLFTSRGAKDTVTLIRDDGVILARNPRVPVGEKLPYTARIFSEVKKAPEGSYESFSPIDSKARIFSYSLVGDYPMYLMVSEVKDDILAGWRYNSLKTAALVAFAIVALGVAGFMIIGALRRVELSRHALAQKQQFNETVLNSLSAHVAILAPDATIIATNKAWQEFAQVNGYKGPPEMSGISYFDACKTEESGVGNAVIGGITSVIMGVIPEFQIDYPCNSDTEERWFTMKVVRLQSKDGSVLVSHENVTRIKQAEEKAQQAAHTDALTGIPNRRRFFEQGERQVALARRHDRFLSLILIDCDFFKRINDTYGHDAGDTVLKALARELSKNVRRTDLVARVGGEEFTVLLPETSLSGALQVAELIRSAIEKLVIPVRNSVLHVTVSLGVTSLTVDMSDLSALMHEADDLLYKAKNSGRNRAVA